MISCFDPLVAGVGPSHGGSPGKAAANAVLCMKHLQRTGSNKHAEDHLNKGLCQRRTRLVLSAAAVPQDAAAWVIAV